MYLQMYLADTIDTINIQSIPLMLAKYKLHLIRVMLCYNSSKTSTNVHFVAYSHVALGCEGKKTKAVSLDPYSHVVSNCSYNQSFEGGSEE